ncbi:MAG: NAD(P)/FAD-dependent oxidoreductase [Gammaproteobacteria bacterium]|nr:NAD(P)/FAD-dependent oxidoreductase [Gammaproteobacteria bacterium]
MKQKSYDVIIIGAGASGLFCAFKAAERGREVLLLDHQSSPGQKITVSGGGRCNFTNMELDVSNYISQNPAFCFSALKRFSQFDCIRFFESLDLPYEERKLGQLFCTVSAEEIVKKLVDLCEQHKVEILLDCRIAQLQKHDMFSLQTNNGELKAESVVIATGGLSYKNLGASDFGMMVAKRFGINTIATQPALVPLTFNEMHANIFKMLSGISMSALLTVGKESFRDDLLFTHKGLSGPAILQVSSYVKKNSSIIINVLPDIDLFVYLKKNKADSPKAQLKTILAQLLPKRFVQLMCDNYIQSRCMQEYSDNMLQQITEQLQCWELKPTGNRGYGVAEATCGGVDTHELSSKTFESKKVAGLYFIGEVIDVTGQLGGYNLQWAWSSGYCCGQFV